MSNDIWDDEVFDTTDCEARIVGISDLVICEKKEFSCPYMIYFGSERFCNHPDNVMIATRTIRPH